MEIRFKGQRDGRMNITGSFKPGGTYTGLMLIREEQQSGDQQGGGQPAPFKSAALEFFQRLSGRLFTQITVSKIAYTYMSNMKLSVRKQFSGSLQPLPGFDGLFVANATAAKIG